jgi:two-component system, cell cycle sensor histidine kinase and response regulator CckA
MNGEREHQPQDGAEESYRNIFNSVAEAIYILTADGIFIDVNDSSKRISGFEKCEIIGRTPECFSAPGLNGGVNLAHMFASAIAGTMQQFEWWARRADGTVFPMEVTLTSGIFKGSRVIIATARDITDTKMLQAQFLRAQRLESLGTLAGGIAHDLNNVLAPILMAVEMLRSKTDGERKDRAITTISASATRGKEILHQVLTFAKGVDGDTTVFHPKLLIRELEYLIKETFPRSIQIRTQIPNDLWTLCASITHIHQVMMNLCVNARDAMAEGGQLAIFLENAHVTEEAARHHQGSKPGPYLVMTVSDTGTGIPAEIIGNIFDPFFTTKEHGRGTGLGLSTVQSIVKGYGGFVTVYSEVSVGTTIRVYLPACVDGKEIPHSEEPATVHDGVGECILVVDDEQSIINVTREILEMNGYQVITAKNGKEGIAAYESSRDRIALVLTDIMMPLMDGYMMMVALRAMSPELKIIAASGLPVTLDIVEPAVTAADAFLSKPYSVDTLLTAIHNVLHTDRVANAAG